MFDLIRVILVTYWPAGGFVAKKAAQLLYIRFNPSNSCHPGACIITSRKHQLIGNDKRITRTDRKTGTGSESQCSDRCIRI